MKLTVQFILASLFTVGLGSIAAAESPVSAGSLSASSFEAMTLDQLDAAFETYTARSTLDLSGLAGPTSMDCVNSAEESLETCVVRLIGNPIPAELAAN